jgi:hypothetical protein
VSKIPVLVPGQPFSILAQLLKDGAEYDMAGASSVKCRVVTPDNESSLSVTSTLSSGDTGGDWSTSKVVVKFSGADTQAIQVQGAAEVELIVTLSGSAIPYFIPVKIVKGHT